MRRFFFAALAATSLMIAMTGAVHAHELKVDGNISGVLHIEPDDSTPAAGKPANFVIYFSDNTQKFDLADCNCAVSITKNGEFVDQKPLNVSKDNSSDNEYTFAEPGLYTLRVTGTSKTPGKFQPFMLTYQISVADDPVSRQSVSPLLWVTMATGVGVVLLSAFAFEARSVTRKR